MIEFLHLLQLYRPMLLRRRKKSKIMVYAWQGRIFKRGGEVMRMGGTQCSNCKFRFTSSRHEEARWNLPRVNHFHEKHAYDWVSFVFYDISSLSKDIQCHVWSYSFLRLQITIADIYVRPHIWWAIRLVIADGHLNLLQGLVWVCTG